MFPPAGPDRWFSAWGSMDYCTGYLAAPQALANTVMFSQRQTPIQQWSHKSIIELKYSSCPRNHRNTTVLQKPGVFSTVTGAVGEVCVASKCVYLARGLFQAGEL